MTTVPFVKMSGAGNDFIVLDAAGRQAVTGDWVAWVRGVCRRGLSVGADGVLVVSRRAQGRVKVEFHNPDGGAAFCGNGSRCAARFARTRGMVGDSMVLETAAGDVEAKVVSSSEAVRVELRLPGPRDLGAREIATDDGLLTGRWIDAGSPHFVTVVDDVRAFPLELHGPNVRRHPTFGERGTNFDIVAQGRDGIDRIRTWERGVEAETLACGSGAVAAALGLRLAGRRDPVFRLQTAGGALLDVGLDGADATLGGDARWIYEARLSTEAT